MTSSTTALAPSVVIPPAQSTPPAKKTVCKFHTDSKRPLISRPFSNWIYIKVLEVTDPNSKYPVIGFLAARIYMLWTVAFIPLDMAWNVALLPITFTCILIKYTVGFIPIGKNRSLGDALPGGKAFGVEIASLMICTFEIGTSPGGVLFARSAAILHAKMTGYRKVIAKQQSEDQEQQELLNIIVTEEDVRVVCRPPPLDPRPRVKAMDDLTAILRQARVQSMIDQASVNCPGSTETQGASADEWEERDSENDKTPDQDLNKNPRESFQNKAPYEPFKLDPESKKAAAFAAAHAVARQIQVRGGLVLKVVQNSLKSVGTVAGASLTVPSNQQRGLAERAAQEPGAPLPISDPNLMSHLSSIKKSLESDV